MHIFRNWNNGPATASDPSFAHLFAIILLIAGIACAKYRVTPWITLPLFVGAGVLLLVDIALWWNKRKR